MLSEGDQDRPGDDGAVQGDHEGQPHPEALPPVAARLMLHVLEELARCNTVAVNAIEAEITTQRAADLLNISRPSLIQLLDEDKLPYRPIGTPRRVPLEVVLAHKAEAYAKRKGGPRRDVRLRRRCNPGPIRLPKDRYNLFVREPGFAHASLRIGGQSLN